VTIAAAFKIDAGPAQGQGKVGWLGSVKTLDGLGWFGTGSNRTPGAVWPGETAEGVHIGTPGINGGSSFATNTAPQSFRSSWQQMVAAFDGTAEERASATPEAGGQPRAAAEDPAISSSLRGNLAGVDTVSQALAETFQAANTQSAQASAIQTHIAAISAQEAAPESAEESNAGAASVRGHSEREKPSVTERAAAAKPAHLPGSPLLLNDAATAIVVQLSQPVQPAMPAIAPVRNAPQLSTMNSSNANIDPHQAIAFGNAGLRVSVSNTAMPLQGAKPSLENAVDRSPEPEDSIADGTSRSRSVVANHAFETTVEPPVSVVSPVSSNQPTASPRGVTDGSTAEASTPSPTDDGSVSWLGSVSDAEGARRELGGQRAAAGAQNVRLQNVRLNDAGNSQLNPGPVEGIHSQLNGSVEGRAVIRDTASGLSASFGPAETAETASGTSTAETFSALDGAGGSMQPTWIHAGAHQAEAGFEDPALGWVSVRAGVNASGISAVVLPGSSEAVQALGAHMAGLHDYLAEHHTPVENLTMAPAQNSGADASLNQDMQHQGRQQSAGDGQANGQALNSIAPISTVTTPAQSIEVGGSDGPAILSGLEARYISVMA
jgi:hypothetical protein